MRISKYFTLLVTGLLLSGLVGTAAFGMESQAAAVDAATISETEARAIALKDAGVNEEDITYEHIEKGTEQGTSVYEIEFNTATDEYDYEIATTDGSILSFSGEMIAPSAQGANITETDAKKIALENSDLTEKDVTFISIKQDYDDDLDDDDDPDDDDDLYDDDLK